jgi:hypothetical protein
MNRSDSSIALATAGKVGRNALRVVVGVAAIAAPALHSLTDFLEWYQGGFSSVQLWLNYFAFLPMSWLLLGVYVVHDREVDMLGLVGALLYGVAFTYFAHTTLYALVDRVPTYEALWQGLGATYTVHGAIMVAGGLLFARSVLRAGWLPKVAVRLFAAGLVINLLLALLPAPEILQTLGTTLRNLGLMWIGYAILSDSPRSVVDQAESG